MNAGELKFKVDRIRLNCTVAQRRLPNIIESLPEANSHTEFEGLH